MTDTIWVCDCGVWEDHEVVHKNHKQFAYVPQSKLSLAVEALKNIAKVPIRAEFGGTSGAVVDCKGIANEALEAIETEVDG